MKIYIIERDIEKFKYLVPYFDNLENVILINSDFKICMQKYDIQCIVSPANSFGIMTGGYDKAIIDYFGKNVQNKVQNYIKNNYNKEQPVATSFIIDIDNNKKLIHTPTMRIPKRIKDERIIYRCMKATLLIAIQNNIQSILIPLFGGSTGRVHPDVIAQLMKEAYNEVYVYNQEIENDYIKRLK